MSFVARIDRFCTQHPEAPRDAILASRLLFHTARAVRQAIASALRPFDLSMDQYLVLCLLGTDDDEPSSPSLLGDTLDITRTQMTRLLDPLEARGLLTRRTRGTDRRSVELRVSPEGQQVVRDAAGAVHAVYQRVWGTLPADVGQAVVDGLRQVHDAAVSGS